MIHYIQTAIIARTRIVPAADSPSHASVVILVFLFPLAFNYPVARGHLDLDLFLSVNSASAQAGLRQTGVRTELLVQTAPSAGLIPSPEGT